MKHINIQILNSGDTALKIMLLTVWWHMCRFLPAGTRRKLKKRLFFLCSHLHLFHLSLYLACQASLHPLALHPPVLSSYHPSLLAICLSFSDFFLVEILKNTLLICLFWFPALLFQCCLSLLLLSSASKCTSHIPSTQQQGRGTQRHLSTFF